MHAPIESKVMLGDERGNDKREAKKAINGKPDQTILVLRNYLR
jgi:hypothetical protein